MLTRVTVFTILRYADDPDCEPPELVPAIGSPAARGCAIDAQRASRASASSYPLVPGGASESSAGGAALVRRCSRARAVVVQHPKQICPDVAAL